MLARLRAELFRVISSCNSVACTIRPRAGELLRDVTRCIESVLPYRSGNAAPPIVTKPRLIDGVAAFAVLVLS